VPENNRKAQELMAKIVGDRPTHLSVEAKTEFLNCVEDDLRAAARQAAESDVRLTKVEGRIEKVERRVNALSDAVAANAESSDAVQHGAVKGKP
jgi:hypothetical protein